MAVFSSNSVRQLFVANTSGTGGSGQYSGAAKTVDNELYLKFTNALGQAVISPRIPISKIKSTSSKAYAAKVLRSDTIAVNTAVVGQTYNIRIVFRNWGSGSAENQYFKYTGTYKCKTGDTVATIMNSLKDLAVKNFAREAVPLLTFGLAGTAASATMATNVGVTATAKNIGTAGNAITLAIASVSAGAAAVTVTGNAISVSLTTAAKTIADLKAAIVASPEANALITITGTDATAVSAETTSVALTGGTTTGITITEVAQPWVVGKQQGRSLNYYFQFVPITDSTGAENVAWGTVTSVAKAYAGQGTYHLAADQEYFYLGERGDKYRNVGFPYTFDTTYLVDQTKLYDTIDITYSSVDSGAVGVENDLRVITVLCANGTSSAIAKLIASDVNTATGLTTIPAAPAA